MATAEERMKILDMVREGKVSAEEGARLLQALTAGKKAAGGRDPRWLRVRITDIASGRTKVSVNIPMSLVSVGIKMGARFVPSSTNFNYQNVLDAIKSGASGKIVDMEDQDEGERVEIWIE
jgi:SHOCT-like protein